MTGQFEAGGGIWKKVLGVALGVVLSVVLPGIGSAIFGALQGALSAAATVAGQVLGAVGNIVGTAASAVGNVVGALGQVGQAVVNVGKTVGQVVSKVGQVASKVVGKVGKAIDGVLEWGRTGLRDISRNNLTKITDFVSNPLAPLKNGLGSLKSPGNILSSLWQPTATEAAKSVSARQLASAVGSKALEGAVGSASSRLGSQIVNGTVNFKDLLKGAGFAALAAGGLFAISHTPVVENFWNSNSVALNVGKPLAKAGFQGAIRELQGGDFRNGVLSSLVGSYSTPVAEGLWGDGSEGSFGRIATAGLLGGLAEKSVFNGSFAEGFATAAWNRWFNEEYSLSPSGSKNDHVCELFGSREAGDNYAFAQL